MVDVNIRGGGPSGTIVWGEPGARRGGAGAVCHHIAAVALEDDFPNTSQVSWLSHKRNRRLGSPGVASAADS